MPFHYGRCPCRGGHYETKWVEVSMTVDGAPVVLADVSQGACPQCMSRVYKAGVLARIEAVMKGELNDPALLNPAVPARRPN